MKKHKIITIILAGGYLLIMIDLLFLSRMSGSLCARDLSFQDHIKQYVSIVPFRSIYRYSSALLFHTMNTSTPIINLFGNIIVFIPAGFFIPVFFQKARTFKKIILISVIAIFLVELIQFFTYTGIYDIDDIILNTLGISLGYACWKTIKHISS